MNIVEMLYINSAGWGLKAGIVPPWINFNHGWDSNADYGRDQNTGDPVVFAKRDIEPGEQVSFFVFIR